MGSRGRMPLPDLVVTADLSSVLTGLAALYVASALSHLLLQPRLPWAPVFIWVSVICIALVGMRVGLTRWTPSERRSELLGVAVVVMVVLSSVFHLYLLSDSSDAFVNLGLLGLGLLGFLLPLRLVSLMLTSTLGFWLLVAWLSDPTTAWLHFSFGLFAAAGIRLQLEFRKARLEETNSLLEQALESAAEQIRKREQAEEELRESRQRYALMAEGSHDGLWDWSLRKGNLYVSRRWKTMAGLDPEQEIQGPDEWFSLVHPEDRDDLKRRLYEHIESRRAHFECEYRVVKPDGSRRWMLCRGLAVRDEKGKAYRIAGSQTDITRRKSTERQLWRAALHDSLTGLPNRSFFLEQLEARMHSYRQDPDSGFAVLFIDLDRFKVINDSLGHLVGDELLKASSQRLQDALREGDTVSRFGGDEFAILLSSIDKLSAAVGIAERIQRRLRAPVELDGRRVFTNASIGIVLSNPKYARPEEMLRDADIAMYRAKAGGKAYHAVFDDDMHAQAVQVMQLEHDLRLAVERGEFRLYYQPVVALSTGEVNRVEGLLRWQHPERGLLSPGRFLTILEETGMVISIGSWTLREACRQASKWRRRRPDKPPLTVSVNLSPRQFSAPELPRELDRILGEAEVDPQLLILEITEDATIHFDQESIRRFAQLRKMGIRVHLDDFGTGYSSLSYLHRLQFDAVKIDRSFINRLERGGENHQIVQAMTDLVHNLGMEVVVEGVETAGQLALARELGCEYAQGYYFCRPLDADSIEQLLDSNGASPDLPEKAPTRIAASSSSRPLLHGELSR